MAYTMATFSVVYEIDELDQAPSLLPNLGASSCQEPASGQTLESLLRGLDNLKSQAKIPAISGDIHLLPASGGGVTPDL